MANDVNREARTYKIPPIEIYEVTDEQLELIEESCWSLGQDLAFAIASLSICASFGIALSSASPSGTVRIIYFVVVAVSFAISLYTGCRWLRMKGKAPGIVQKIRSRKTDPESSQEGAPL